MTTHTHRPATPPTPGEIVSARVLPATRDEVFAAIRDPVRLAQWWGPKGFTNTFRQFEFHPGGAWRGTMRGPDGNSYEMNKQFTEIVSPERIVVQHFQEGHDFIHTMTLAARGNSTELTWELRFADPAAGEKIRSFILSANEENFDRLAAHLSAARPVVR
jgi:uncharacterized protein YndB with AHSA1/START domain